MPSSKLEALRSAVDNLYREKNPERDEWADWLYEHHVLVVAEQARRLAKKYEANIEQAEVSALLHDIADAVIQRTDPNHETKSLELARSLLIENNYSADEIELIVGDALRFHSCHNGEQPSSLEGKVLSTADAYAHLETDFYFFAMYMFRGRRTYSESKAWVLAKLERDFTNKIFFEDERNAWRRSYETLKELLSR